MKTLELVGKGHPDRFSDYISEKILMANLKLDINSKVASEVMVTRDIIFLGGEISSNAKIDYEELVFNAIEEIYGEKWWPNYRKIKVINNMKEQSKELNIIQNESNEIVAGDQGVIYGFYSPKRINIINKIYDSIIELSKKVDISPDWKLLYDDKAKIISASFCGVKKDKHIEIKSFLQKIFFDYELIINPKGEWLVGGPLSDTGLTGRKIMIDTFGSGVSHGGGAFCGKDFSKVDKTGIIIATEIAKNYFIKNNLKEDDEVSVELVYKIGDSKPIAYIYHKENFEKIRVDKTLHEWIKESNIYKIDWSNIVKNGGISSLFKIGFFDKKN